MFNKYFDIRIHFRDRKKKYGKQLCDLKNWIKARRVITENILLLKYQKQAITSALNVEDTFLLLPIALRKSWIYQVSPLISSTPFISSSPTKNKVPNREFYWSADHEFYARLGIWKFKSMWSAENWCYCAKVKAL